MYVRTRNTPERKGQREVIKQMPSNNFVVVPGKEFRHELRFLRVKMRRKVLSGVCTHTQVVRRLKNSQFSFRETDLRPLRHGLG